MVGAVVGAIVSGARDGVREGSVECGNRVGIDTLGSFEGRADGWTLGVKVGSDGAQKQNKKRVEIIHRGKHNFKADEIIKLIRKQMPPPHKQQAV